MTTMTRNDPFQIMHATGLHVRGWDNVRAFYAERMKTFHGQGFYAHRIVVSEKAIVGKDASLQWTIAAIGSRLSKVNQQVELAGRGAESQVNGVLFTEGKQHISYHTHQHHAAPECRSDFLYKAALQDQSRTVWRGMIKVDPKAVMTNGYQRNDNLLLSSSARADSIPGWHHPGFVHPSALW